MANIFRVVLILMALGLAACTKQIDRELIGAAANGDLQKVKALLNQGANIEAVALDGWTPLTVASREGHKAVASFLISKGADVNHEESGGNPPLLWAALDGHRELVELLLANGVAVKPRGRRSGDPLLAAVVERHYDIAKILLLHGADPTRKNYEGLTPLGVAQERGDKKMIDLLTNAGKQQK